MKTKTIYAAIDVPEDFDISKLQVSMTTDTEDEFSLKAVDFRILPEPQPVADEWFEALNRELVLESERAIEQRDKFLITGKSTAGHGGSHDTCFSTIVRKYFAMLNTESRPQGDAELEQAPCNSLPSYDECKLRVENSDFIAKHIAEGGYGAEPDSLLANQLHRFIYEYDDADPYRSAWFLHRLELLINEVKATTAAHGVPDDAEIYEYAIKRAERTFGKNKSRMWVLKILREYIAEGLNAAPSARQESDSEAS